MKRTILLMFTVGLLVVGATGCGSSSGGDSSGQKSSGSSSATSPSSGGAPDTASISKGLQKGFLAPEKQANCVAKKLEGKVSVKALRAIANASAAEIPPKESADVLKQIAAFGKACR